MAHDKSTAGTGSSVGGAPQSLRQPLVPRGVKATINVDTSFDTAYSAGEITGRVRAIERPMTARDYTRGLGLFPSCDFA